LEREEKECTDQAELQSERRRERKEEKEVEWCNGKTQREGDRERQEEGTRETK
jgi:hypothetical protein